MNICQWGKPVVATKTEAMDMFKDYIRLATNESEFVAHIMNALENNSEEKVIERVNFTKSHSWENSVNKILKNI